MISRPVGKKHPNLLPIGRFSHFHSPEGAYNFDPLKPGRRDCWALRVTINNADNSFIFFNFFCWEKEYRAWIYAKMEARVRHQVDQLELDNIHCAKGRYMNLTCGRRTNFYIEHEYFYLSGLVVNLFELYFRWWNFQKFQAKTTSTRLRDLNRKKVDFQLVGQSLTKNCFFGVYYFRIDSMVFL